MKKLEIPISIRLKFICIILFIPLSIHTFGQKNIKYKDVYKVITEKSREEAYSLLLVFIKQEPSNANAYLQLGLLAQFWSKDIDALSNLKDVEFFISNANAYFDSAYSKLEQKEIRRNDKYYRNIERFNNIDDIDIDAVKMFIQEQVDANKEYKKNINIVTDYFNLSISYYLNCLNLFKEINIENNTIKDFYLTAASDQGNKINKLEKSFDSTIYYLQNYQTAIKNYPIKKYNQKYKLIPVEAYRLHGLTGSDFLKDEIAIWDYGTWVKNVKQILNTDIKDLRVLIKTADNQFNNDIKKLVEFDQYESEIIVQKLDETLKYKIGKFEHKAVLLEFFKYKESKLEFLALSRDPLNNPNDSVSYFTFDQKSRYYEKLIKKKAFCDSLADNFINQLNPYELNKYNDFFSNTYGGKVGLGIYFKTEKLFLNQSLSNSINNYKKSYLKLENQKITYDSISYKNGWIPISRTKPNINKIVIGKYYTVDYLRNISGDYFLTGFFRQDNNKTSAFVARTNKTESIKWIQIMTPEKQEKMVSDVICTKDDGCAVIFNVIDTSIVRNQIISFDIDGKPKEKIEVGIAAYPRYFNYDEINQKYLIVCKGKHKNINESDNDELIVSKYDALSKIELWKTNFKLNGRFVDAIKMDTNIYVITNYTKFQTDMNSYNSQAGDLPQATNSLIIVISDKGVLKNEIPINSPKPFYVKKAIKLDGNTINLIGFKGQLNNGLGIDNEKELPFLFLLFNKAGKVCFDNFR